MKKPPKYFVYKCVWDDGSAPCVDGGLWSLCLCKPIIRRMAQVDDFVVAFGPNNAKSGADHPNRLVSIAKVTKRIEQGDYFRQKKFFSRKDCIFRESKNVFRLPPNSPYCDSVELRSSVLGRGPKFSNAITLLSDDFRYFGESGNDEWKLFFPRLKRIVEGLRRGHRVNHSPKVNTELIDLIQKVWKQYRKKTNGPPKDSAKTDPGKSQCKRNTVRSAP